MTTIRITKRFGPAAREPRAARPRPPTRLARMLALAYHVTDLVEDGRFETYADAARAFGITRARMIQILDLLLLPPPEQQAILLGEDLRTERQVRRDRSS